MLWAITWNNKKELSHSIGMGKPYGFGQIKAEIKSLSFLENSTISNDYSKATAEKISLCLNKFSTFMESKVANWKTSPQLKELFAMADPKMANRPNWKLEHLSLADKEFSKVKGGFNNPKEYLAPYSSDGQVRSFQGGSYTSVPKNQSSSKPKIENRNVSRDDIILGVGQSYEVKLEKPKKDGKKWRGKYPGVTIPITLDKKEIPGKKEGDIVKCEILQQTDTGYIAKIIE